MKSTPVKPTATFRFYAELNDFLPPGKRHTNYSIPFAPHQTIKDLIEAQGIPHGEVEVILVNGASVHFSARPKDGDHVSVFPIFESFDVKSVIRLRAEPLREIKFLLDVPLGRLASHLRLFGFDTIWERDQEDRMLVIRALEEHRVLLTRDRRLLMRKIVTHGYFVREIHPSRQLIEVIRRFQLEELIQPFVRCLRCNGLLIWVEKETINAHLEPKTRAYYDEFSRCNACGRIYWQGSHYEKIAAFVADILKTIGERSKA